MSVEDLAWVLSSGKTIHAIFREVGATSNPKVFVVDLFVPNLIFFGGVGAGGRVAFAIKLSKSGEGKTV